MSARRQLTISGVVMASLGAAGWAAAKGIAVRDRRRAGVTRRQSQVAAGLGDPSDARHRMLTMSDGATVHVVERGPVDATPIVLLHGVTLSTRIWHYALDALGDRFRLVALDWRGHGTSTAGRKGYGLPLLAEDLAEVLDQLDLRRAVLVGHSMGGMAIMRFCGEHPQVLADRVSGLVFLSTASALEVGGPWSSVLLPLRSLAERVVRRPGVASLVSRTPPGDLGYAMIRVQFGPHPSPLWVERTRHIVSHMDPQATAASITALLGHDARSVLAHVSTPALVVVGTKDRVTPPFQARLTVSLLPQGELVQIAGAGHLVMLERQDDFHRMLAQFAERVVAAR